MNWSTPKKQNAHVGIDDLNWERRGGKDQRKLREVEERGGGRKEDGGDGGRGGRGLMCPSWGEAGQKRLSGGAKLTPLQKQRTGKHQWHHPPHPSQTGSYNSQKEWWVQRIRRMQPCGSCVVTAALHRHTRDAGWKPNLHCHRVCFHPQGTIFHSSLLEKHSFFFYL